MWLLQGGHVWLLWGACMVFSGGGVCVVFSGGGERAWFFPGGACVCFSGWHAWFFSGGAACIGYKEIRSMSILLECILV